MRVFSGARVLFGVVVVGLAAAGVAAAQLKELPAGPNRDLVQRTCTACHDLQMVLDTGGLSREDWDVTLTMMTTYGMDISDGDRLLILRYLATYLPPQQR